MRFARIGKLYRLVKLTRLLRVFKILKNKNKVLKMFQDLLKVSIGFERLFFFVLMFLILVHIVTCLWIMLAQFFKLEDHEIDNENDIYSGTWMHIFVAKEDLSE